MPFLVATLLARAINLPAITGKPPAREDGKIIVNQHRHAYYPSLKGWVHGDALASTPGIKADRLFRSEAALMAESPSQQNSQAYLDAGLAVDDLESSQGISTYTGGAVAISRTKARSWYVWTYYLATLLSQYPHANAYATARFGILGATITGNVVDIPTTRYSLLDQVAAYLPLDGTLPVSGRVENRTLRGADGIINHGATLVANGRRGAALALAAGASIDLPDQRPLTRNNQELTLSLHYWPVVNGGTVAAGINPVQLLHRQ